MNWVQPLLIDDMLKLFHDNFGGIDLAILGNLQHIDTGTEAGDADFGFVSGGAIVNSLTHEVEEFDVSLFGTGKGNRELVGGRVRINRDVFLLHILNSDGNTIVATELEVNLRIVHVLEHEAGIVIVNVAIGELHIVSTVAQVLTTGRKIGIVAGRTTIVERIRISPCEEMNLGIVIESVRHTHLVTFLEGVANADHLVGDVGDVDREPEISKIVGVWIVRNLGGSVFFTDGEFEDLGVVASRRLHTEIEIIIDVVETGAGDAGKMNLIIFGDVSTDTHDDGVDHVGGHLRATEIEGAKVDRVDV